MSGLAEASDDTRRARELAGYLRSSAANLPDHYLARAQATHLREAAQWIEDAVVTLKGVEKLLDAAAVALERVPLSPTEERVLRRHIDKRDRDTGNFTFEPDYLEGER